MEKKDEKCQILYVVLDSKKLRKRFFSIYTYGYYDSCRANGNSSLFCECATIDYYDLEDVFEFCSGYESCVSQGNSRNRCVCQGFGELEETCIEIGDCP